jgi:hypothetical protein
MELLPFDRLVGLWCDMALASLSPDADAWNDPFACIAVVGHESHLPMCVCVTDATRRPAPGGVRTRRRAVGWPSGIPG